MSTSNPLASVVICTRNRARSLERTLESLAGAAAQLEAQAVEGWELIVVDNGSSDNTAATAAGFAARLPVRVVPQPIPGLSNARNAGVAATRGDYVLWTDDDVVVDPQWLVAWFRAFRTRPDNAVFGGRTEPRFEEPRQDWFIAGQEHLEGLLAVRDRPEWTSVSTDRMPWGLNFAVRGIEQRATLYDPELGVAPGRRRGGEETAVISEILARGGSGSWVWDATVFHLIPPERQTAAYILEYYAADAFDYPIAHPRSGVGDRLKGLIRTIGPFAGSMRAVVWGTLRNQPSVAGWVGLGKVRGTVHRYLTR